MNTNDLCIILAKMSQKKITTNDLIDILALMLYSKMPEDDLKKIQDKLAHNTKENQ